MYLIYLVVSLRLVVVQVVTDKYLLQMGLVVLVGPRHPLLVQAELLLLLNVQHMQDQDLIIVLHLVRKIVQVLVIEHCIV